MHGAGVAFDAHANLGSLREALSLGERAPESGTVLLACGLDGDDDAAAGGAVPASESAFADPAKVQAPASGPVERVLALVQEWLADEQFGNLRLTLITEGAVGAAAGEGLDGLACAPVGAGALRGGGGPRTVRVDRRGWRGAFLERPRSGTGHRRVAARDPRGRGPCARLVRADVGRGDGSEGPEGGSDGENTRFDPVGTVLVTGGTGVLGGLVARHLVVGHGVRRLLLASRSGEGAEGVGELRGELESLGAVVEVVACDVGVRGELEGLLGSIDVAHPLCGVVHAAGVLDDGVIGALTGERLREVLAAKADAAWYLHELTQHLDLGLFVLFSSAAGVFGSPGQGSYAAANAFLDGLAAYRRARGLCGVSLAWGLWEQATGLTGGLRESDLARMARGGMRVLSDEEGLRLFDRALGVGESLLLPVPLEMSALRAQARAGVLPALFGGLVRMPARRVGGGSLARRLAAVPEGEREGVVLELVRAQAASVLGHSSGEMVDVLRPFKELGFDSLTAVELRNRLNAATGLRLAATLVFDYPTVAAVAAHILGEFAGSRGGVAAVAGVSARALDEPLAIVGMSCRYPGGVCSPEALWDLVAGGRRCDRGVPVRSWVGSGGSV